jgi:hypothetical protein
MKCVLCGRECESETLPEFVAVAQNSCGVCGDYLIALNSFTIDDAIERKVLPEKWVLSGISRQLKEKNEKPLNLTNFTEAMNIALQFRIPQNPLDKIDMLIEYFYNESGHFNKHILFDADSCYPLCFAINPDEMKGLLDAATNLGYISVPSNLEEIDRRIGMHRVLTLKGWERIVELRKKKPSGNQCFVAMWFEDNFFNDTFPSVEQAIRESGYKAECVKVKIHNNKICDEIIAGIRRSSLVIADMTNERFAVSFEAGFAMGLNIPVILTCREDVKIEENFDIRQYPHIIWKDKEQLKNKLAEKIQSLYPVKII